MASAQEVRLPPLRTLRARYGLILRKRLGQHLLCNERILRRIVQCCGLTPESTVIEIGAGFGHLTCQLARQAYRVLAIEYDDRFRAIHERYLAANPNIKILYADFLRLDLQQLVREIGCKEPVVVGNIPYRITSRIVLKCLSELPTLAKLVITMQKEVAERMVALPGKKTFGSLTVKVQFFSKPRIEFLIGRENFLPSPKVDSATVSFVPVERRKLPCNGDWRDFFAFIEVICRHRRKSLKTILRMSGLCGVSKANIQRLLEQVHIESNLRPESLSLENYIALYEAIQQRRQESLESR